MIWSIMYIQTQEEGEGWGSSVATPKVLLTRESQSTWLSPSV